MITIQIIATPVSKINVDRKTGLQYIKSHLATIYRDGKRYKVTATSSLDGVQIVVSGSDKPTGWENFCSKWAERFQKAPIRWGYSFVGGRVSDAPIDYFGQWDIRLVIDKSHSPKPLYPSSRDCNKVRAQARHNNLLKGLTY